MKILMYIVHKIASYLSRNLSKNIFSASSSSTFFRNCCQDRFRRFSIDLAFSSSEELKPSQIQENKLQLL